MVKVLIAGIGGTNSISILKALNKSDVPHISVGTDLKAVNAGSFLVDKSYLIPRVDDAAAYTQALEELIAKENIQIIFATTEKEIAFLASVKHDLQSKYNVVVMVPEESILATCQNKNSTQVFLREHGFTYIPTILATDKAAVRQFAETHGYPVIKKPVYGYGSQGIAVLRSEADLDGQEYGDEYVVQEYIEVDADREFEECTAEVFVNKDMSIAGGIIIERTLFRGESKSGKVIHDQKTLDYLIDVAKALGIQGPCNFQYRVRGGKAYIFEINARYSGTTAVRANFGFNNVDLALRSFVLGEHQVVPADAITEGYFVRYWEEAYADVKTVQELTSKRYAENS